MAASKGAIWGGFVVGIGVVAGIAGLITFASGKNLPDFFQSPPPQPVVSDNPVVTSEVPPASEGPPAVEPTTDTVEPTFPSISAIRLPTQVFEFDSFMNETRQSHTLDSSEVGAGVYVYGYWEDPKSIWLDATVTSGAEGLLAVSAAMERVSATAQQVKQQGSTTCAWVPDSDPNTPRHGVQCFRIDSTRGIAMITDTHTATVGDIDPFNLANEIWGNLEIS